ncbi:MAG: tetratricopeptide repeat protein [Gemmataceae bacterium]
MFKVLRTRHRVHGIDDGRAQFVSGGFVQQSGFRFSSHGGGFRFSAGYSRTYYSTPMFGYAWVPAFGPGYGPGFGNPFFLPPPPIVVGPPLIIPVGNREPVPGHADVVKGDFLVISPRKADEVDRVVVPEKPPRVVFNPFAENRPIGLTEPPGDPERQLKRARAALAVGEYGAAVEFLDRLPNDEAAVFFKSQAQFAAGQYAEAVATIRAGMKRNPKWASNDVKLAELFPRQLDSLLGELKRRAEENPDSHALQFLLAHQLWFGGERETARPIFERLAKRLKAADEIRPFLDR